MGINMLKNTLWCIMQLQCIMQQTNVTNPTMHLLCIPQCTIQNRNVHICSEWCIVGYVTGVLWDMWIGSIVMDYGIARIYHLKFRDLPDKVWVTS